MVSIRKIKNREGVEYVHLMESFRENGKPKCLAVKSYGRYDKLIETNPNAYEELRERAKRGEIDYVSKRTKITETINLSEKIGIYELKGFGHLLLESIYNQFNLPSIFNSHQANKKLSYDINTIFKALVTQRILKPNSKLATQKHLSKLFGCKTIPYNHIDRSLDHLNTLKSDIQKQLHKVIATKIGRDDTLVFYDVTNYYFQVDIDDELRKRGPSKEHRPKPIVQMGMFMDSNFIPISYELFRGNCVDVSTYAPALINMREQFGAKRIVIVADKAMNSKTNVSKTSESPDVIDNIEEAQKRGNGWVFSSKIRGKSGVPKDIQNFALDKEGWEYNKSRTFAMKSFEHSRILEGGRKVREKVLITWSQKYANREKIRRDGAIEFAEGLRRPEVYRLTCKKGGKKYIRMSAINKETGELTELNPFLDIDYEKVAQDARFDGLNCILTSEVDYSNERILESYRGLNRIEDCFRITKSELNSRPVYHRTKEHIEAHFLSCFVALVVVRVLQHLTKHKWSPRKMIKALRSAKVAEIGKSGYLRTFANSRFVEIAKLLNGELNYANNSPSTIKKLANLNVFHTF